MRLFKCGQCGKAFKKRGNLTKHTASHINARRYICHIDQCGCAFNHFSTLRDHLLTHSNVRPFPCEQCGKAFKRHPDLKRHMLVHSSERPFVCSVNQCRRTFKFLGNLKTHQKSHSGKRPFKCEQCGKAFKTRGTLKTHGRTQHKDGKTSNWKQTSKRENSLATGTKEVQPESIHTEILSNNGMNALDNAIDVDMNQTDEITNRAKIENGPNEFQKQKIDDTQHDNTYVVRNVAGIPVYIFVPRHYK